MEGANLPAVRRPFTFALAVACSLLPLGGATLERLSLEDMIARSTTIVRGTVGESWTAFTGRNIYTHYKVRVSERFKGPVQRTVEISIPGGTVGELRQTASGSPVLNKGDEFVFFLWTSKSGVTWVTGLTQGLFALSGGSAEASLATRPANRELMLDPATARPVRDNAVSMKLSELRTRIAAKLGLAELQ
jgi:hypothetical protein